MKFLKDWVVVQVRAMKELIMASPNLASQKGTSKEQADITLTLWVSRKMRVTFPQKTCSLT